MLDGLLLIVLLGQALQTDRWPDILTPTACTRSIHIKVFDINTYSLVGAVL